MTLAPLRASDVGKESRASTALCRTGCDCECDQREESSYVSYRVLSDCDISLLVFSLGAIGGVELRVAPILQHGLRLRYVSLSVKRRVRWEEIVDFRVVPLTRPHGLRLRYIPSVSPSRRMQREDFSSYAPHSSASLILPHGLRMRYLYPPSERPVQPNRVTAAALHIM